MDFFEMNADSVVLAISSPNGLNDNAVRKSRLKHGENILTKPKRKSIFSRFISALFEPMILILLFAVFLTLGLNIGKLIKTGQADFTEVIGIIFAILLSTIVTVVMEENSIKAFETLSAISENAFAFVKRNGKIERIKKSEIVVGDIVIIKSGDKIFADGRVIKSLSLSVNESALTGESNSCDKFSDKVFSGDTHLADRANMVYAGTFVTVGSGEFVVTAVGNKTEMGVIAKEVGKRKENKTPLEEKLASLSKTVSIIGCLVSLFVFIISVVKILVLDGFNFYSIETAFLDAVVLIVASVPEGLPSIVAVSLAINMIKLSKENALIKKLIATETVGAVSVICTDKTGTLTENKMKVDKVVLNPFIDENKREKINDILYENFCLNSNADIIKNKDGKLEFIGSPSECALLIEYEKSGRGQYSRTRSYPKIVQSTPFSSENKFSEVVIDKNGYYLSLLKGAPEKIIDKCNLENKKKEKILKKIVEFASLGNRVLCFSHCEFKGDLSAEKTYEFDGFVVISDTIRKEVYSAIEKAKSAGIDVKMLTGDNIATATNIAYKTGILTKGKKVVTADYIDKLSFEKLKKEIKDICVIARSTPIIKLKVVKALNAIGEVTCVTGDGVNDAPAIRQADVGISMGITGSEITKDASDIVLLDDSFNTVIKAVSFGRTVYKNLKRFIFFQLSVNISALLITVMSLLFSFPSPFSAMQLLFVNIIMDGPPALTLGLEKPDGDTMKTPPVKRNEPLIKKSEFFKVLLTGVFIATVTFLQYAFNFLAVNSNEVLSSTFMLFLTFSLFNAFNARAIGTVSAFSNIKNNKVMAVTFLATFLLYLLLSSFFPKLIGVTALSVFSVIKVVLTASTVVFASETVKLIKRKLKK